jgi:hypothetical protein
MNVCLKVPLLLDVDPTSCSAVAGGNLPPRCLRILEILEVIVVHGDNFFGYRFPGPENRQPRFL